MAGQAKSPIATTETQLGTKMTINGWLREHVVLGNIAINFYVVQ